MKELREDLRQNNLRRLRNDLDCWHSNARTRVESLSFKFASIEYYSRAKGDTNILCMLTNMSFPARFVRASLIFKRSFEDELKHFGSKLNIDHPRNGLLLLEPIEERYDRKDLCFLYNSTTRKLHANL